MRLRDCALELVTKLPFGVVITLIGIVVPAASSFASDAAPALSRILRGTVTGASATTLSIRTFDPVLRGTMSMDCAVDSSAKVTMQGAPIARSRLPEFVGSNGTFSIGTVKNRQVCPVVAFDHGPLPPLIVLAAAGDTEHVKQLLASGTDLKVRGENDQTALHVALQNQHVDVAEALMSAGAPVNVFDSAGDTPLMIASYTKQPAVMEALIDKGANVAATDGEGVTALHKAAFVGANEAVQVLLAHGADPNLTGDRGATALMMAAQRRANGAVIRSLLAARADPNVRDPHYGYTAIDVAKKFGDEEMVALLEPVTIAK